MLANWSKWLSPSVALNDEEGQLAHILQRILLIIAGFLSILLIFQLYWGNPAGVWGLVVLIMFTAAVFWLARRGQPRAASFLLALILLGVVTVISTLGQGIHDITNVAYPAILVGMSLLLKRTALFSLTILTIIAVGWLVLGAVSGLFVPQSHAVGTLADFVVVTVVLLITAVTVQLLTNNMRQNLAQAQQEIAERKETEAALQASEERYRIITELISDYAYAYRVEPDGSFTFEWITSDSARRMTGYDPLQEIGSSFILYHPEDQARANRDVQETLQGKASSNEYRIITKTGDLRWVHISRQPVWNPEQQRVVRFYGVSQDITERKQAEVEREQLIAELEAKNAELERFTYTVSHDLKAPLVTIKGFLGWLQKDLNNQNMARVQLDVERIREAAEKMHVLLDELLELSRIGRLMNPPENVPFETIVREALALVEGRLAERQVQVEVAKELPVVYGDQARLVEVVQNLVDNAAKFMGSQPQPRIEIGVCERAGESIFFVRDNGIGIAPQYHEKVFGLFDKLEPQSNGTGIGLALVKRIVEVHGGRIWVESAGPEQGATFCFSLPTVAPN